MDKAEKKPNLFSITKEHLTRYPFYKVTVQRSREKLQEITAKLEGINAIDYDKIRVTSSPTEDMTTNLLNEKLQLEEKVRKLNDICLDIEAAVDALPEPEQTIIRMYYMETNKRDKRTWIAIAFATNYSERQCRYSRDSAIKKIGTIFE